VQIRKQEMSGKMSEYPDLVVVGAGLFGLTVAQQAAERAGASVEIIDVRSHIGGNAYSYFDERTGIEIHKYGAHLFHTHFLLSDLHLLFDF
jgi:UDP-galactopyranose mutase